MKLLFLFIFLFSSMYAKEIATAMHLQGKVTVKNNNMHNTILLKNGDTLKSDMTVITSENSSLLIIFKDNTEITLGANSILNLEKFAFKPMTKEYEFELFLQEGSMTFESGKVGELSPENFILKTPDGTVAIRGTKFFIKLK